LFRKHGVEVKIYDFTGGSKMAQAMAAGSIDIGLGAGTETAFVAKGAPMRAVCEAMPSIVVIGIAVPYHSSIHTLAELKGKRIGISSSGSLTDWMAKRLSEHEGWGPNGVKRIAIGNGAAAVVAAFRTNAIDADISVTANIFNWEAKKIGRLLAPATSFIGNMGGGMIYASQNMIENEPAKLRGFLAGWLESVDYLSTHEAEALKIYSRITGYPTSVMTKEYNLTTKDFSHDCRFDAQSMANLRGALIDQKLVNTPPVMSKLYTEAYLPKHS
jgi:ABC-type nitrate/sulfonate/bicarbonate transport system substrate-binding protein